jgi:hypothetical protein
VKLQSKNRSSACDGRRDREADDDAAMGRRSLWFGDPDGNIVNFCRRDESR